MAKNGTLLWVDDEIELLRAHILFLKGKDYEVDTATNGRDALDRCRERSYDLILLDENMPGLTGLETLTLIKEVQPTVPVVMVTKSEEEDISARRASSGSVIFSRRTVSNRDSRICSVVPTPTSEVIRISSSSS